MTNTATTYYTNRHYSSTSSKMDVLAEKIVNYFRENAESILSAHALHHEGAYGYCRYNLPAFLK